MNSFKYQNSTKPLTLKQRRFLVGYQQHGNATRAAREAGFSEKYAAGAGHRLLQHPLVKDALRQVVIDPTAEYIELPSGLRVSFSYGGIGVFPSLALTLSKAGGSPAEMGIWRGGLAMLGLLTGELEQG
jgi:hypothetical protein